MNRVTAAGGNVEFNSPEATEAIDHLVQNTESEIECAKIVGRKFVDIQDHASYLGAGVCARIIDELAGRVKRPLLESGR